MFKNFDIAPFEWVCLIEILFLCHINVGYTNVYFVSDSFFTNFCRTYVQFTIAVFTWWYFTSYSIELTNLFFLTLLRSGVSIGAYFVSDLKYFRYSLNSTLVILMVLG